MEKHERLKRSRIDAGFRSAADAARALGVPEPTYYAHENGRRDFDDSAARAYARRFGVTPEWLTFGSSGQPKIGGRPQENVSNPDQQTLGLTSRVSITNNNVKVLGVVAAGAWLEVSPFEGGIVRTIPVPSDPRFSNDSVYGLEVAGTSINKIASEGDVLVCVDIASTGIEPEDGDLVIVERRRAQLGIQEVTAKRIRRVGGSVELHPESTDPQWQTPIELGNVDDDIEVRILARVEWIYRSVRARR